MRGPRLVATHRVVRPCLCCGGNTPGALSKYCLPCGRVINAIQRKAVTEVKRAIARGLFAHPKTLTCTDCGARAHDYDHRDYRKPLSVEPVCRPCNMKRGSAIGLAELVAAHA